MSANKVSRVGKQSPTYRTRSLYDMLTDKRVTAGIVVHFDSGIDYVVGEGWQRRGRPLATPRAYRSLAVWWEMNPKDPRPDGT